MAALHQRDAESALQFREGLRNAWLRSLKLGCGFAEALETRDRHENPQLLKIWKSTVPMERLRALSWTWSPCKKLITPEKARYLRLVRPDAWQHAKMPSMANRPDDLGHRGPAGCIRKIMARGSKPISACKLGRAIIETDDGCSARPG
jgi:hypothetical protein